MRLYKHRDPRDTPGGLSIKKDLLKEASFRCVVKRVGSVDGQLLFQVFQVLAEVLVGFAEVVHRATSVEHRRVVLSAAVQSDVGERRLGHLLGEVHGNLSGLNDFALSGLALEELDGQVEVVAHHLLDVVDADLAGGVLDKLVDHVLGQIQGDRFAVQACLRHERNQRAFELTHVGRDAVGEVLDDLTRQLDAVGVHLLFQDGHARFQRGNLEVGAEPPLKAGQQALLHALHFNRRLVRRQHDLLSGLVQVVEDVEEHVLRLLLATEELHIIDDEHIHHLVKVAEVVDRVVSNGVNELVREALRAHVQHCLVRLTVLDLQPNCVREVRLAQSNTAVDEEGVEGGSARLVGHGKTGASCKSVALAFNKVLEGVVGVEVGINVEFTQPRNDKGILDGGGFADNGHGHLRISGGAHLSRRHVDGVRAA